MVIPEYSPREAKKLLGAVDARKAGDWRLEVALHVSASPGRARTPRATSNGPTSTSAR